MSDNVDDDMTNQVHITSEGKGGRIKLDGVDVSLAVTAIAVEMHPNAIPVVKLELLPGALHLALDAVEVKLDEHTLNLLDRLGWTPPEEVEQ